MERYKIENIELSDDTVTIRLEDGSEVFDVPLKAAQRFCIGETVELVPQAIRKIKAK